MNRGGRLLLLLAAFLACGCAGGAAGAGPGASIVAAAAVPPGASHARRILVRRCQNCHALPNPAKYERAAWERKLVQMERKVRMAPADWDSLRGLVPAPGDSAAPASRPRRVAGGTGSGDGPLPEKGH